MDRAARLFAVIVCAALAFPDREVRASCGSSCCPIDTANRAESKGGELLFDVSMQYINQNRPRVGQHPASVGNVPNADHNEIATINRIWNFRADYELDSRWGVGLLLPLVSRTHDHFDVADARVKRWGFTGVGDLIANVRYAASPHVTLTAAGKFPTGRTGAHNSEEPAEVTIQPGSGSYDFIGGATYARTVADIPLFAGVSYRRNTPGTQNYRMGDAFQANLGGSYRLARKLELLAQANLNVKRKDDAGHTTEDTSFTGGNFLYLSPGLRWHMTAAVSAYGYIQLPVYQRVNQEQITSPYNLLFGMTYQFNPVYRSFTNL